MTAVTKSTFFVFTVLLLALAVFPVAAKLDPAECGAGGIGLKCAENETPQGVALFFWRMINGFLVIVSMIAAGFLIWGGIKYVQAAGNESQIEEAKRAILYSIIGLIIVGLAASIINFVILAVGR